MDTGKIAVKSMPAQIPDEIEVKINDLTIGDHLKAGDIQLPEGLSLASDPDVDVAVCSAPKAEVTETEGEDEEEGEA